MTKFVIDEDMPRSTAGCLRDSGYEVMDIRDHGLRGAEMNKYINLHRIIMPY